LQVRNALLKNLLSSKLIIVIETRAMASLSKNRKNSSLHSIRRIHSRLENTTVRDWNYPLSKNAGTPRWYNKNRQYNRMEIGGKF
jgi:hypothetical protein